MIQSPLPAAAPGDTVEVFIKVQGRVPEEARLTVTGPDGWTIVPAIAILSPAQREVAVSLHAPSNVTEWPMRNLFTARLASASPAEYIFGVAGAGLWRFLGVYYDALPDEDDPKQISRRYNQHYVSLERDYLPEPDIDIAHHYQSWSRNLGRPAVVSSYQHEVDPSRLIGLRGPFCCYLARTIISPEARPTYIVVGNNDGFRLYLNGELVAEEDECLWWTPFNNVYHVDLRQGPNQLLIKLLKRTGDLRFTLGLRAATSAWRSHHNSEDWLIDLADGCDWL